MGLIDPVLPTSTSQFTDVGGSMLNVVLFIGLPVAVGVIFFILGPIIMLITLYCRCCKLCGSRRPKPERKPGDLYLISWTKNVRLAFLIFCAVCIAGVVLGATSAKEMDNGIVKLVSLVGRVFDSVIGLLDKVTGKVDNISPTINAQAAVVSEFTHGLLVFLDPIENINSTLVDLTASVRDVEQSISVANANLTEIGILSANITTILSSLNATGAPATNSLPALDPATTGAITTALSSLSSSQSQMDSMAANVRTAINSVDGQVTPALTQASTQVDSALGSVRTMIGDFKKQINDQRSMIDTYINQIKATDGQRDLGGILASILPLPFMILGLVGMVLKNNRIMSACAFFAYFAVILFFLLFTIEILFGQLFAVYCFNYESMLTKTLPSFLPSGTAAKIPDVMTCDGSTNMFEIFDLMSNFNVSSQINVNDITNQASQLNRTSDINSAKQNIGSVTGSLGSVNVDLKNINSVIADLSQLSQNCSDLTNFNNPTTPGTKLTQSDINTAASELTFLNAILDQSTWTLPNCQNSPDNAAYGCTNSGCPAGIRLANLTALYNINSGGWVPAQPFDQCPFKDFTNSTFVTHYTVAWPIAKVSALTGQIKPMLDRMVSDLQGIQTFAGSVTTLVNVTVPASLDSINVELDAINQLSADAAANLTTTAHTVIDNISGFVMGMADLGQCKFVGDIFRDFNDAVCNNLTPGLSNMGWGHLLIGIFSFSSFFIAIVSGKRFLWNRTPIPGNTDPNAVIPMVPMVSETTTVMPYTQAYPSPPQV